MFTISPSVRVRPSPYFEATVAAGVKSFTTYNHMMMPTGYGDPEAEYWRLINGVSQWDVAVERQVQLLGPDASRLAQMLAARDLEKCVTGQGRYVALCDHSGTLINDPILLKLADDRFWLSIADADIIFWARAIAAERRLNVSITEPDVSPMAVQGPMAEDVVASVFGDWVRELKYFWFRETSIKGIPVAVARSGWSKQGGFELYLMDGTRGTNLWDIVREAGRPWDIGPGNPNHCERIESGLVNVGGDTDDSTNPFEVGMARFIDLNIGDDVIGIEALRRITAAGPRRHLIGIVLEGKQPLPLPSQWSPVLRDGKRVGDMTNCVWSYRLNANIGFGLVSIETVAGDEIVVLKEGTHVAGRLRELPFC